MTDSSVIGARSLSVNTQHTTLAKLGSNATAATLGAVDVNHTRGVIMRPKPVYQTRLSNPFERVPERSRLFEKKGVLE